MLWKRQPPQRKGELNWREVRLVPKKGLEPPHPCEYMDLNHARLPIPPLRHACDVQRERLDWQQILVLQRRPSVSNARPLSPRPGAEPVSPLFHLRSSRHQKSQKNLRIRTPR